MLQVAILVISTFLTMAYTVMNQSKEEQRLEYVEADTAAVNFLSYRDAVKRYLLANPTATGTIVDASLTWQTGYVRDPRWTNVVSGGVLYVYTSTVPPKIMTDSVYQKTGRNIMVGVKDSSGNLVGPRATVPAGLPAVIPVGALIYSGS